ncbi:MAG: acylphosphatase [Alphaproteobacteria bacterium]|nr:MAG: acylphosphatase [Alphaproteobacteria bacterium]
MNEDSLKAVRLRISGQVQGVWFRAWTVEQARALGLDGWVRNRRDGTVEVLAAGDPDAIRRLISLCHDGPPAARVDQVEVEAAKGVTPHGFDQKPTV